MKKYRGRKRLAGTLLLASLVGLGSQPCEAAERRPWRGRWWASVALVAAANLADLYSSRGLGEANPMLRDSNGRFSLSKGVKVKSAATGGFLLLEVLLLRKSPESRLEKPLTLVNIGAAGSVAGIALRNYHIQANRSPGAPTF